MSIRKVVINKCYGGFDLSEKALSKLKKAGNNLPYYEIKRDDPQLIKVVEQLGDRANGEYAKLKIVKIPSDVEYVIEEYDDGKEHIVEKHRIWS